MRRGIYLLIPLLVVSSGIFTTGPAMRLYGKPVQILPKIMVQYKSWVFRLFYQGASEVGEAGSPLLIQRFRHPRIEEEGGRRRELAYSTLFSTVGFLGCTTSPSKCGAQ